MDTNKHIYHIRLWFHGFRRRVFGATLRYRIGPSGRVMVFDESDYQYGIGHLTLRVERIDRSQPMPYEGEDWFPIEGIQINAKGDEVGRRRVLVRAKRLNRWLAAPYDPAC